MDGGFCFLFNCSAFCLGASTRCDDVRQAGRAKGWQHAEGGLRILMNGQVGSRKSYLVPQKCAPGKKHKLVVLSRRSLFLYQGPEAFV